jgi:hypothetical protein
LDIPWIGHSARQACGRIEHTGFSTVAGDGGLRWRTMDAEGQQQGCGCVALGRGETAGGHTPPRAGPHTRGVHRPHHQRGGVPSEGDFLLGEEQEQAAPSNGNVITARMQGGISRDRPRPYMRSLVFALTLRNPTGRAANGGSG